MHLGWLRCSSVTYLQHAPSSRLAIRAPRPRSSTDLAIRGPLGADFALEADQREQFHARGGVLEKMPCRLLVVVQEPGFFTPR